MMMSTDDDVHIKAVAVKVLPIDDDVIDDIDDDVNEGIDDDVHIKAVRLLWEVLPIDWATDWTKARHGINEVVIVNEEIMRRRRIG